MHKITAACKSLGESNSLMLVLQVWFSYLIALTLVNNNKNYSQRYKIKAILDIGNFMNYGPLTAPAIGFRLSFLSKVRSIKFCLITQLTFFSLLTFPTTVQLSDTKSVDNKTTFMHYLVNYFEKKSPQVFNIYQELSLVEAAAKGACPVY